MIVTQQPVSLFLPPSKFIRSDGVHQSAIIRCIATEAGILKNEWADELNLIDARQIVDPSAILRISIGLAWEEWYIPNILGPLGVIDHPGEMKVDGIYMTHDGESLDVIITSDKSFHAPIIHEVKATYKSVRTVGDLAGEWMWITQMKGYCKGAGTRFAKLHVLFLCGDYKFPITPQLKVWLIEFTQKEIDEAWDMLKEYKEYRESREQP